VVNSRTKEDEVMWRKISKSRRKAGFITFFQSRYGASITEPRGCGARYRSIGDSLSVRQVGALRREAW
jgi:hypothetical protein